MFIFTFVENRTVQKVLTAVKMVFVLRVVTLCDSGPVDGSSMFLRNVAI
jgi:hypothetical protein